MSPVPTLTRLVPGDIVMSTHFRGEHDYGMPLEAQSAKFNARAPKRRLVSSPRNGGIIVGETQEPQATSMYVTAARRFVNGNTGCGDVSNAAQLSPQVAEEAATNTADSTIRYCSAEGHLTTPSTSYATAKTPSLVSQSAVRRRSESSRFLPSASPFSAQQLPPSQQHSAMVPTNAASVRKLPAKDRSYRTPPASRAPFTNGQRKTTATTVQRPKDDSKGHYCADSATTAADLNCYNNNNYHQLPGGTGSRRLPLNGCANANISNISLDRPDAAPSPFYGDGVRAVSVSSTTSSSGCFDPSPMQPTNWNSIDVRQPGSVGTASSSSLSSVPSPATTFRVSATGDVALPAQHDEGSNGGVEFMSLRAQSLQLIHQTGRQNTTYLKSLMNRYCINELTALARTTMNDSSKTLLCVPRLSSVADVDVESIVVDLMGSRKVRRQLRQLAGQNSADLLRLLRRRSRKLASTEPLSAPIASSLAKTSLRPLESMQRLRALNRHTATNYDSEATEESSGEEDELLSETPITVHGDTTPSLRSRPEWRFQRRRGGLIAKAAYAQRQISINEYNLRQLLDIELQSKTNKSPVVIPTASAQSRVSSDNRTPDTDGGCARVRGGYLPNKRKLVRTPGMFEWNRKAARLSEVRCGCALPYTPGVCCSGRVNNHESRPDPTVHQTAGHRAAILDPGYPAAGANSTDISWNRFVDVALKNFQQHRKKLQPSRCTRTSRRKRPATLAPLSLKTEDVDTAVGRRGVPRSAPVSVSKRSATSSGGSRPNTPLTPAANASSSSKGKAGKLAAIRRSTLSGTLKSEIDNIYIDPAFLAAPKIERIPYKEIQLPSFCKNPLQPLHEITEEPLLDDMNNEAFAKFHEMRESEERRRFESFKKLVYSQGRCVVAESPTTGASSAATSSSNKQSVDGAAVLATSVSAMALRCQGYAAKSKWPARQFTRRRKVECTGTGEASTVCTDGGMSL